MPSSARQAALKQDPRGYWAPYRRTRLVLTGGGARCATSTACCGRTGLPVIVADDPLTCVVRGSGRALEEMDKLASVFTNE